MRVGYYPTRNFATIGPSWLRPSFTKASVQSFGLPLTSPLNRMALDRRQPLYFSLRFSRDLCFW